MLIQYRTFRNFDPPVVADLWNASLTEPGAAALRSTTLVESFLLAKPYFDPEGVLLALVHEIPAGFAISGFGPGDGGRKLDYTTGVLCALGVAPQFRRQGIGSALLSRAEEYLRRRGADKLFAGASAPANPYTFALYGGAQSSGFLDSSDAARPFLERRGYRSQDTSLVYRCPLEPIPNVVDGRFPSMRQRYEIQLAPRHGLTWYQEGALGPVELHEFHLCDKLFGRSVVRACVWEMETYAPRWNQHAVGVLDIETVPDRRGEGLAKFLLAMLLRHLREQFFTFVETHVPETDDRARRLLEGLGFVHSDTGRRFKRE
jgi:ribosomal protein S18 acetylase RimI-like enzyme